MISAAHYVRFNIQNENKTFHLYDHDRHAYIPPIRMNGNKLFLENN